MGCGCGKKATSAPVPVDADTPNPNVAMDNPLDDPWWQAHPVQSTVAVPMPS